MHIRQLMLGIMCMVLVANLQYAWTLFVLPIDAVHHWGRPAIQTAFSIFILAQTWLAAFEGYLMDRFGPSRLCAVGGVLVAASWILNGTASTIDALYVGQFIGGLGVGVVVAVAYGNALKWYEARRGLAVGLTAAGYGAGSALTIIPIAWLISRHGYQITFIVFGVLQGVAILVVSLFLRAPQWRPQDRGSRNDFSLSEMLRTPAFWVMYAMFIMVCAGGLMAVAQLAPIAHDYRVADVPVTALGFTMPALVFALSLDRIMNGVSRPLFGWISDQIGREAAMFVAFVLEAVGVYALTVYAHDPLAFVVLSGLVFLGWGEIFSLFPSLCTDLFGKANAARNYGVLYTAKGVAALLVPIGSVVAAGGHWDHVLGFVVICDIAAALAAVCLLLPMRLAIAKRAH